jgi:transcription initiation factor IIE alpha subunit
MIIRETTIYECWCEHCHKGQMKDLFQKAFDEKIHLSEFVGQTFKCEVCGEDNTIEDFLTVVPHSYMIASKHEFSKAKSNDELGKYLRT